MKEDFKRCKVIQLIDDSDDDEQNSTLLRTMARFTTTKANMMDIEQQIEEVKARLKTTDMKIDTKTADITKIEERIALINDTDKIQKKIDFYTNLRDNKERSLEMAKDDLQTAREHKETLEEEKNDIETELKTAHARFDADAVICWDAWDDIPHAYKRVKGGE